MKRYSLAILASAALLALTVPARAERVTSGVIMPNTPFATRYYVKTGDRPGPVVMVIGGFHGNETAGYLAARKLTQWTVTAGTLVVLPDASKEAIRRNVRAYPANVNAMFPGKADGDSMRRLAYQIFALIKGQKPDLLVTLHESIEFHKRDPKRYGQTLCYDFANESPFMQRVLDRVNPKITESRDKMSLFVEPHATCPTYVTASTLHIPATSIETCRSLPLALRLRYQLMTLQAFFDEMGLETSPPAATASPSSPKGKGRPTVAGRTT